jgi:hypothetical protein
MRNVPQQAEYHLKSFTTEFADIPCAASLIDRKHVPGT